MVRATLTFRFRRRTAGAISAALCVVCASCSASGIAADPVLVSGDQVGINASITGAATDRISVRYQITNTSDTPVVVVSAISSATGDSAPPVDDAAYRVLRGDGTLEISRRVFSNTPGDPAAAVRGTKLQGGDTADGVIRLRAPITTFKPGSPERTLAAADVKAVTVCVGIIDMSSLPEDVRGITADVPIAQGTPGRVLCTAPRQLLPA